MAARWYPDGAELVPAGTASAVPGDSSAWGWSAAELAYWRSLVAAARSLDRVGGWCYCGGTDFYMFRAFLALVPAAGDQTAFLDRYGAAMLNLNLAAGCCCAVRPGVSYS